MSENSFERRYDDDGRRDDQARRDELQRRDTEGRRTRDVRRGESRRAEPVRRDENQLRRDDERREDSERRVSDDRREDRKRKGQPSRREDEERRDDLESRTGKDRRIHDDRRRRRRGPGEQFQISSVVDQMGDALLVLDTHWIIRYVNTSYERITGYSRDEALGTEFGAMILGDAKDETVEAQLQQLQNAMERGDVWDSRVFHRTKDGSILEDVTVVSPLKDLDGRTINYVVVMRDLDQDASLAEKMRQSAKLESIGRLAGGIAHDFNNIITVIAGYTEILQRVIRKNAPDDMFLVDEIAFAASRAADLTQQLLAFSRQTSTELEAIDLRETLEDVVGMLRRIIGEQIELVLGPTDSELWPVVADRGQIQQILLNFASNARDAMPEGGVLTVTIDNCPLTEDSDLYEELELGTYVRITVRDIGVGMDKATLDRIFEPFFSTKGKEGTGLGLATVYGIVKQHGGHIWCESTLGKGTVFTILVPAREGGIEPVASEISTLHNLPGGDETILVVEDDQSILLMATQMLETSGYTVLKAANGEQALEAVEDHPGTIDMMLSDVVLPDTNGRELAERLQKIRPDMKVLFTSGYTDDIVARHGIVQQDMAFIPKPYTLEDMLNRIRLILDGPYSSSSST